jgi:hypothetical protein
MNDPPVPGTDHQRWFFVHILKTGGTDLFTRLGGDPSIDVPYEYEFQEAQIYPNASDGNLVTVAPQLAIEQLMDRWAERRDEIRIVMGHFPMCTIDLLDADFTTLSVVREPVARTLSFLRHHRKTIPADRDTPYEDIYADEFRFRTLIQNHMVKMFALTADEMGTDGMLAYVDFTREHLERAKERVATIDVLGTQEHFAEFCSELERQFGWMLGEPLWANRTEPDEMPDSLIERIREDNALDIEFYEFVRELCESRAQRAPAPATPAAT